MNIVLTTINSETQAVKEFKKIPDSNLIIIGDAKTPAYEGVITLQAQRKMDFEILEFLPENNYARKNIGYLLAAQKNSDVIFESDDDNIPSKPFTGSPAFSLECPTTVPHGGFVNVYRWFSDEKVWPRGYPLTRIIEDANKFDCPTLLARNKVGVWQAMADGNPDVDAIYRLTIGKNIMFHSNIPLALSEGCYCPFNSQSTFWRRELLPLMYLPAFVSMRFTDILRGYIAQCIMQHFGYSLGFCSSVVYQRRNEHNLMNDFALEQECYAWAHVLPAIINRSIGEAKNIGSALFNVYCGLLSYKIVKPQEIQLLECWLRDCENVL